MVVTRADRQERLGREDADRRAGALGRAVSQAAAVARAPAPGGAGIVEPAGHQRAGIDVHEAVIAGHTHGCRATGVQTVAELTAEAEAPAPGLARRVESATVQPRCADLRKAHRRLRAHRLPGAGDVASRAQLGCRGAELAVLVVAPAPGFARCGQHARRVIALRHAIEGERRGHRGRKEVELAFERGQPADLVAAASARGQQQGAELDAGPNQPLALRRHRELHGPRRWSAPASGGALTARKALGVRSAPPAARAVEHAQRGPRRPGYCVFTHGGEGGSI